MARISKRAGGAIIFVAVAAVVSITSGVLLSQPNAPSDYKRILETPISDSGIFSLELVEQKVRMIKQFDRSFPRDSRTATAVSSIFYAAQSSEANLGDILAAYLLVQECLDGHPARPTADDAVFRAIRRQAFREQAGIPEEHWPTAVNLYQNVADIHKAPNVFLTTTASFTQLSSSPRWKSRLFAAAQKVAKNDNQRASVTYLQALDAGINQPVDITGNFLRLDQQKPLGPRAGKTVYIYANLTVASNSLEPRLRGYIQRGQQQNHNLVFLITENPVPNNERFEIMKTSGFPVLRVTHGLPMLLPPSAELAWFAKDTNGLLVSGDPNLFRF